MTSAPQEEPYDVLDGFFDDARKLGAASGKPKRQRPATQKLGYAGGILVVFGLIVVMLGTLAWIGAFVFNQLITQVG